eukprot:c51093_g1_i1 orf=49-228(+)
MMSIPNLYFLVHDAFHKLLISPLYFMILHFFQCCFYHLGLLHWSFSCIIFPLPLGVDYA